MFNWKQLNIWACLLNEECLNIMDYIINANRDKWNWWTFLKIYILSNWLLLIIWQKVIEKLVIVYRGCNVSYNCNDPVTQSECSVLTVMRNSVLFIFFSSKLWHLGWWKEFKVLCCNELNIKDCFIGNIILKYCFVSILWGFIHFARYQILFKLLRIL